MGQTQVVEVLVEGGNASPKPPLGPTLSQLRLPLQKVIQDINNATKEFKGMQVPVKIIVDVETREYKIEVGTPPVSSLVKKELGINTAAHSPKHEIVGNLSMEQVVKIAKIKIKDMNTNDLKKAVKTVLGTLVSMGVNVENKHPKEIQKEIDGGKRDHLIK